MRIISGTHKGKRLRAPKNLPVRPTTDFAKEALFNILNNRIDITNTRVLDLFSGTGNIAYEFASRGSQKITAVDQHYGCCKFINATAKELEFPIQAIKSDVFGFLDKHSETYELVFADPPYAMDAEKFELLIQKTLEGNILTDEGILIVEHPKDLNLENTLGFDELRRYGGSCFSFFKKTADL